VEWQLEHPAGTEEDATAFLRVVGPGVMAANQRWPARLDVASIPLQDIAAL